LSSLLKGELISKHFGGLKAVDSVDFDLDEGEILGLIGPNGAGKTTLFAVMAGSTPPTSGHISFDGKFIEGWPAHRVVHAGICRTHQIVRPFAKLTVLENVLVGRYYGKGRIKRDPSARDAALGLLEFVGLDDRRERLPAQLTLAGRKRLEVVRALATDPRVLLLDEVVAGLNPSEAQGLSSLIKQVREERGISIIMIEHVMPAVMGLSDRVMVLDEGKKIAEGTPEQVANNAEVIKAYLGEDYAKERSGTDSSTDREWSSPKVARGPSQDDRAGS